MKKFRNSALALLMCLIGLMAAGLAIVGWVDPEGADKTIILICVIFAFVSFLTGWFLWKP